ncbi:ABC-2 type transport system permease protein [Sphingomonas aurantiaca]|uniref:ABC-2 type transport system permease protein n=1 Tax=Sphingomonas aurantiaca TaxID=185949 RepID=A0A2T5GGR7_9SPHN|nr:ABC transporter permease [Sphingomonas aurantiaca]PTQ58503.1 ABC-2 type transport system permease protein [Sphingomonas aurantiaca]
MTAFRAALVEELAHLWRDRFDLALLTLVPLVCLVVMGGMMARGSPRGLGVVIVDQDRSTASRAIVRAVGSVDALSVIDSVSTLSEAFAAIRRERAVAVVVLPRGLGSARRAATPPTVEIFYQTAFLSTGALTSALLQATITAELARQAPSQSGLAGVALLRVPLPGVEVTLLGNASANLEWYLGLLIGPAVLHLLIAVTAAASLGRELIDGSLGGWAARVGSPVLAVAGRLVPHVAIGTAWLCLWLVWLTLGQGFAFTGAIGLVAIGGLLLFVASAAIAALLILLTGEVATSLSASVIYAGSALAYSGASLPITGGLAFARIWSAILPLTHYVTLEMDQAIGVDLAVWAKQAAILLLAAVVASGGAALLLRRQARRAA